MQSIIEGVQQTFGLVSSQVVNIVGGKSPISNGVEKEANTSLLGFLSFQSCRTQIMQHSR